MECCYDCEGPADIKWTLDDTELTESSRVHMAIIPEVQVCTLTVAQLNEDDTGEYTCVIKSNEDQIETSTFVTIITAGNSMNLAEGDLYQVLFFVSFFR